MIERQRSCRGPESLVEKLARCSGSNSGDNYREDLEKRFGYLREFAKYWNVNAVYANLIRNCDIHGYEVPSVKDYFESLGLPVLIVEQDYSTAALEPLRARFQAFAERINRPGLSRLPGSHPRFGALAQWERRRTSLSARLPRR